MDRTNYHLLSIVAIVALTAILAMFMHAQANPTPPASPIVTLGAGPASAGSTSGSGVTGYVIDGREDRTLSPPVADRARPAFDISQYDYSGNGLIDTADSAILADVVARSRFCPQGRICDVNGDGIVDITDLGAFNAAALRIQMEREASHITLTQTPTQSSGSFDPAFGAATFGAPLE